MKGWLTLDAAAKRVDRSKRTIYRWEARGLIESVAGCFRERDLLAVDKKMRARRGRPPKKEQS